MVAARANTDPRLVSDVGDQLIQSARTLGAKVCRLKFKSPVTYVYNPLVYAWPAHEMYLRRYGHRRKRVIFLGMNPGPFGMAQTGVPFGEVSAVRDWLKIEATIGKPDREHPRRPVVGFACQRSEISGQRLWGLFKQRFATPEKFFKEHLVMNYCPLAFMEMSGSNRTPDKLLPAEKAGLFAACDEHLLTAVELLAPEWVIGIGRFAAQQAELALSGKKVKIGQILHPSPASPAANRNWSLLATGQLQKLGVWD